MANEEKRYEALFFGSECIMIIPATNAREARRKFNKHMKFALEVKDEVQKHGE